VIGEDADRWEQTAGWWQAQFTDGADPEYTEQIIPLAVELLAGATRVLDVGCGDGQVARAAASENKGNKVVIGVDPTWGQLVAATQRRCLDRPVSYARAAAAALPFADASFDAVIACLVFEHIDDADRAIEEVSRVLSRWGRFVLMLNHPLLQTPGSGWIDDQILGEQYWRVGPYLVEDTTMEEVDAGVRLPFVHRPLSRYVNALAAVGLFVTRMEEPAPPAGFIARAPEYAGSATIPRLCVLVAEKL